MHPLHFSIFRMILGTYLFLHFAFSFPYAGALYSDSGMLYSPGLNLTNVLFPFNILKWFDSVFAVRVLFCIMLFFSAGLILGFKRRWMAAILLYGWAALFNRNNLTMTPGLAFIGWMLAVMIFIPSGEPWCLGKEKNESWEVPRIVLWGAWLLMSLGYTLSGIDKLLSPSWVDGSAMTKLLMNPLSRDGIFVNLFSQLPDYVHKGFTYLVLFAELLFLPLAMLRKTRPFVWLLMVIIHLGIVLLMDLVDLTVAMLMIHVFTFNGFWIRSRNLGEPVKVATHV